MENEIYFTGWFSFRLEGEHDSDMLARDRECVDVSWAEYECYGSFPEAVARNIGELWRDELELPAKDICKATFFVYDSEEEGEPLYVCKILPVVDFTCESWAKHSVSSGTSELKDPSS